MTTTDSSVGILRQQNEPKTKARALSQTQGVGHD